MIPSPDPAKIQEALATFDAQMRNTPAWTNWEENQNYAYAIEANGRRYPVKQILAIASGQPVTSFSGGVDGANKVLVDNGFRVVPLHPSGSEDIQPMIRFREALQKILGGYTKAASESKFAGDHPIAREFEEASHALAAIPGVVPRNIKIVGSAGRGNWASIPWIALLDPRETDTTQKGVYIVYLFRGDMSGVYATLNQGVTELKDLPQLAQREELNRRAQSIRERVPELAAAGFALNNNIELRSATPLGAKYEPSTVAHKFYEIGSLPEPKELAADLHALLAAYAQYVDGKATPPPGKTAASELSLSAAFALMLDHVAATGFVFEPWQLAAYVTALRTKPFVILAGVSGTGKSKLPQLVATATGGKFRRVSVRPDWTDSSDVLGYVDLHGSFRSGAVLQFARDASDARERQHVCLLDEMNLARVEQYFAELLSAMEDRRQTPTGFESSPLIVQKLASEDSVWTGIGLAANFALVGTVNMDESTHGFSRKVLDRAFTLEISDVDLGNWKEAPAAAPLSSPWPIGLWYPRALRLSDLRNLSQDETNLVSRVVEALTQANIVLSAGQIQVGYRVRDEVALFTLHARDLTPWFRTQPGEIVDPLDLAIHMKLLPRIAGGTGAVRRVLQRLLGWAVDENINPSDDDVAAYVARWEQDARRSSLAGARLPRTAARLCLMWDRLQLEGFTSYWL